MKDECPKEDKGKLRYSLIPIGPLEELCRNYTDGALKNGDRSWEKGMAWSRAYDAIMRHMTSFWKGENIDKGTGLHHCICAAFWALALVEYDKTHPELDDRPKPQVVNAVQGSCTFIYVDETTTEKTAPEKIQVGDVDFFYSPSEKDWDPSTLGTEKVKKDKIK